ncbi:MAG: VWA domain-containing protein [Candidatus Devosia phytovorans]|uniref:VWA domain-containing protein n=1 Tax=Candidatus Devosia phytovorans TaxID=3121372 RepID=A0AAJ6B1L6_9HYPH|nr:VWA domain-containing protein [Devosia sp.]WEK05901.1 MAG: VWA domain-containing protein [Devosia sp.]
MADKDPAARQTSNLPDKGKVSGDIAAFVKKVGVMARPNAAQDGRLLFALDATMSRQPTWDLACSLQAEMFRAIPKPSALQVQLLYFRGFGECRASKWVVDGDALARLMSGIDCRGGHTQIAKVFAHARTEHAKRRINAVVYVGDAIEENVDELAEKAGQLGLLGLPLFVFQEGRDAKVEAGFREFARLTKGAYARFDASAPQELAALLKAVAAFASGGRDLMKLQGSGQAQALLAQLPK